MGGGGGGYWVMLFVGFVCLFFFFMTYVIYCTFLGEHVVLWSLLISSVSFLMCAVLTVIMINYPSCLTYSHNLFYSSSSNPIYKQIQVNDLFSGVNSAHS